MERFSAECRQSMIGLKISKTSRDLVARVFPRLAPVTYICFEFSLVHFVVLVSCDCFDLVLKTALMKPPVQADYFTLCEINSFTAFIIFKMTQLPAYSSVLEHPTGVLKVMGSTNLVPSGKMRDPGNEVGVRLLLGEHGTKSFRWVACITD